MTRLRVAGVFAHPDDDVYLIGGSLALHRDEVELTVVYCTSGGAGPIWNEALATRETLAEVREGEARAALDALGFPDARTHFLRHPDYYLNEVPREALVAQVAAVLAEAEPHVVVTFGPDGMTSHHDHIRAGEVATDAFHRVRQAATSGAFLRLFHCVHARSDVERFYEGIERLAPEFGGPGVLFNPVGVPDDEVTLRVDVGAVRDRKLDGVLKHGTQVGELERIPEELRWIYLDVECYVQAWPPAAESPPPGADPFAGA